MSLSNLLLPYKAVAIIGLAKNVGKTTVLNHIIGGFAQAGQSLALTSIGRDGEDVDVVTSTAKPRIFVASGTIVITAEGLLPLCDITREILMTTDTATPLGRVVAVRARSAGYVQLGGPSITAQLAALLRDIARFGTDKTIIDGAISRKSFAAPSLADAVVLCTGAAVSTDMDELIAQTRHNLSLLMLQKAPEAAENAIYMPGAVSDKKMRELILSAQGAELNGRHIIADDASKILITPDTLDKLRIRGGILSVQNPINPVAVAINPTAPSGFVHPPQKLLEEMRKALPIAVFDVMQSAF